MNWVLVHTVEGGDAVRVLLNADDVCGVSEPPKSEQGQGRSVLNVRDVKERLWCTDTFEEVVSQLPGYGVVTVTSDKDSK